MGSFQYGMNVFQVATTATAAGTTTLVNTSKQIQTFTGSSTQTVVFPSATTMSVGQFFEIYNQSSGSLTLQFNGGAAFTDAAGTSYGTLVSKGAITVKLQTNGTSSGTWSVSTSGNNGLSNPMTTGGDLIYAGAGGTPTRLANGTSGQVLIANGGTSAESWATVPGNTTVLKAPSISKFTTGTSATYTTPTSPSPLWLEIIVVGGGAGGAGSGSSGAGVNGNASSVVGNNTTTANGGSGPANQYTGGVGGTFSIGAECTDIDSAAGGNGGGVSGVAAASANGGMGGSSALGGAGSGGATSNVGGGASTNSGGGGGGAGGGSSAAPGSGGGAGAYVHCAITGTLKSTYTYTVGASVSGSTGSSAAGGAGAAGMVVFIAHYQ